MYLYFIVDVEPFRMMILLFGHYRDTCHETESLYKSRKNKLLKKFAVLNGPAANILQACRDLMIV